MNKKVMSNQIFDKKKFCEYHNVDESDYQICKQIKKNEYQEITQKQTKELSSFFLIPYNNKNVTFNIVRTKEGNLNYICIEPCRSSNKEGFFSKLKYYLQYPFNYFKNKKSMKELQSLDFFGMQKQGNNDKMIEMKSCMFDIKNSFAENKNQQCIVHLNRLKSLINELQKSISK